MEAKFLLNKIAWNWSRKIEKEKCTLSKIPKIFEHWLTAALEWWKCIYGLNNYNSSLVWAKSHYSCSVISKSNIQLYTFPSRTDHLHRLRMPLSHNYMYFLFPVMASVILLSRLDKDILSRIRISRSQFAICEGFWQFATEFLHFF